MTEKSAPEKSIDLSIPKINVFWMMATIGSIGKQIGKLEERLKGTEEIPKLEFLEHRFQGILVDMNESGNLSTSAFLEINRELTAMLRETD